MVWKTKEKKEGVFAGDISIISVIIAT